MNTLRTALAAGLFLLLPFSVQAAAPQKNAHAPTEQAADTANQQAILSPAESFTLMAGEAERGNPQAMLALGALYEQGMGIARNYSKALSWYQKAADAGLSEGLYNTAICYEVGMGTAVNAQKSIELFEKSAEKGLTQALYKLYMIYGEGSLAGKDEKKALKYLEQAAEKKNYIAVNDLAVVYSNGLFGQKKDEKKAVELFRRAAHNGNIEAVKNLGIVYKDGFGEKADPKIALKWFLITAKAGYPGNLTPVIEELKKNLTKAQVEAATKEADSWLLELQKRLNTPEK